MVDLTQYDGLTEAQEEGTMVNIVDPAGKAMSLNIRIVGPDSKLGRQFQREMTAALREAASLEELTFEEEEDWDIKRAAMCTVGWSSIVLGGEEIPCNRENAEMIYRRFPFIFSQVRFRVQGRAAFMKRSDVPSDEHSTTNTEGGGQ